MASTTSLEPGSNLLEEKCRRLENQISTMKNVAHLRKSLLELRERQVKDLISKLKSYEMIVSEGRESRNSLSVRLESAEVKCNQLTDKLTQNQQTIDELKENYENKVTTLISELETSEKRNQQLSDQLNCAQLRITEVTNDITLDELNKKLEDKDRLTRDLQYQMKKIWERNKALSYQMTLLNNLFTETEGVTIDFEKIKAIGDIVRESQVLSGESDDEMMSDDFEGRRNSLENILETIEKSENVMPDEIPGEESCYKSVDTKRGPQLVLSVSRTFIKLKDLILEKKSLQKEIDTLKSLNTKLESKVDKQEHRLYRVTLELNKTWSLVSKLKQQHKKLYNSEAVLRYELQEKRILLERLKTELSASRDKWRRVRQKNSQSQIEWEKLRDEFEQRKQQSQSSQESGTFSEVMSVSSVENDETAAAEVNRSRKKIAKGKCISSRHSAGNETEDEGEEGAEEDELEGSARTQSSLEDEHYQDPLEELVSNLVADIENEAETREESSQPQPAEVNDTGAAPPVPSENTESESPRSLPQDFEERLKRRAERLRNLEEQCHVLHKKLHASTVRSENLTSKLDALHEHYGPGSGSSTETPRSDDQQNKRNGETSQNQEEVDVDASHPQSSSRNDDEVSTTSTDAAYVSGTENSVREDSIIDIDAKNSPDDTDTGETTRTSENNATSPPPPESGDNAAVHEQNKLIETSENSTFNAPPTTSLEENKDDANSSDKISINENRNKSVVAEPPQESQGHSANTTERRNDATTLLTVAIPTNKLVPCPPLEENTTNSLEGDHAPSATTTERLECDSDSSSTQCPSSVINNDVPLNENGAVSDILITTPQSEEQSHRLITEVEHSTASSDFPVTNNATDSQNEDEESAESQGGAEQQQSMLPAEEPLPIQETVVQHFPSPSEEEANEFAPVQIRPEFLRILQEADEATNNLDWMPSLLTITHSVALLRLDPELPPERTISDENRMGDNGRSVSESLSIEIPQQSPSPPPATTNNPSRGRHRRRPENGGGEECAIVPSSEINSHAQAQQPQENTEPKPPETEEKEGESLPAYAKDPSFLSRMIIKQLPKRLQLLKNENHTLQMETAEAKMRMKEMTRQLSKEVDKQQQLSMNLDTQIEEKHLIEFELREELEKKEKVIEELQMEIDESKEYVDELKKEKEEADVSLRALIEEKWDMEQPKVPLDSVKNCNNCKRPFSLLTRRKFHCKICGKVFCKDCAIPREPNQRSSKRPRLCTRCHFRKQRLNSYVNSYKQPDTSAAVQP